MELKVGLTNEVSEEVTHDRTAESMGSGLLPVYATPAMIALMENCCCYSVAPYLETGQGTVGIAVNIRHVSATVEGRKVRVCSELKAIDGRKLTFSVTAYDEAGVIGEGEHERFVIDSARFMEKAKGKA